MQEDDVLCGQSWYDILWTETNGNAWYILGHQWIAATLNVAAGASTAGLCVHCNKCLPTIYSGTRCVLVPAASPPAS